MKCLKYINLDEFKESIKSVENINGKLIVCYNETYFVVDEKNNDYLKGKAVKGSITENDYVQELSRRILQIDSTLCLEETSLENIQAVLDTKDIKIPAVVFKTMFAEWGFPVLRRKPDLDKKYPYGLSMEEAHNEIKNGVIYW